MIKNTTIILGAGGSHPYGFPLGEALKDNIISQIEDPSNDTRVGLRKYLLDFNYTKDQLLDFSHKLKRSGFLSVDAFLEEWIDYVPIGKIAIAANIINMEMEKDLLERVGNKRWYHYLLNLLGNREDFPTNRLSIITFNYDRSLEYFLYFSLKSRFNLPEEKIVEYIKSIPIIHVHGLLGLPHFLDSKGRSYKNSLDVDILSVFSNQINIIHENLDETIEFREARKIINRSDRIIFLGFGYHRKNIERLKLRENFRGEEIICTFYNRESGEIERDLESLRQNLQSGINSIPIKNYSADVLNFLRTTNYLK